MASKGAQNTNLVKTTSSNPMTNAVCVCILFFFKVNYNNTTTYNTVTHQLCNSSIEWM